MNAGRVLAIANNAFRETIRDRVLFVLLFFILLLAGMSYIIPYLAVSDSYRIVLDVSVSATYLISLVIAVFVGTNLVNKEIEKRTIFTLISKPVTRAELIVGKHLGLGALVGTLLSLMTLAFFVIYSIRFANQTFSIPVGPILLSLFFAFVELLLVIALALFFSSFTSSIIAALLTFAVYLAGHFSPSLLKLGAISKNPFIEQVTRFIYVILPDLERFNLRDGAVHGLLPPTAELLGSLSYGFVYTVILLTAAHLLFSRKEF